MPMMGAQQRTDTACKAVRGCLGMTGNDSGCFQLDGLKMLPSGKRLHNYGTSQLFMGKLTITGVFSIAMLNYQRVEHKFLVVDATPLK